MLYAYGMLNKTWSSWNTPYVYECIYYHIYELESVNQRVLWSYHQYFFSIMFRIIYDFQTAILGRRFIFPVKIAAFLISTKKTFKQVVTWLPCKKIYFTIISTHVLWRPKVLLQLSDESVFLKTSYWQDLVAVAGAM